MWVVFGDMVVVEGIFPSDDGISRHPSFLKLLTCIKGFYSKIIPFDDTLQHAGFVFDRLPKVSTAFGMSHDESKEHFHKS